MRALAASSAWQAECDFDASRGVPFSAFARQRVLTDALTHLRREWAYAWRCPDQIDLTLIDTALPRCTELDALTASMRSLVDQLPPQNRSLIQQLFWKQVTEAEIATRTGVTQQAISRRKRTILTRLADAIGQL